MYNAKFANNFGNLLNRAVVLSLKLGIDVSLKRSNMDTKDVLHTQLQDYVEKFDTALKTFDLKSALDSTFKYLDEVNLFVTKKEPWNLLKYEDKLEEFKEIIYITLESVRQVALNLYAFFPEKMLEVFRALNLPGYENRLEN
jgi:methionyl-tRNA synthetase